MQSASPASWFASPVLPTQHSRHVASAPFHGGVMRISNSTSSAGVSPECPSRQGGGCGGDPPSVERPQPLLPCAQRASLRDQKVPRKRVSIHTIPEKWPYVGPKSEFRVLGGFSPASGAPGCPAPRPHCGKAVNTSNSCLPAPSEILSLFRSPLLLGLRKRNSGEMYLFGRAPDRKTRSVVSPGAGPRL